MPQCEVSTERPGSVLLAKLGATRNMITKYDSVSATECANLCLADENCASFTLDILDASPECMLFASASASSQPQHTKSRAAIHTLKRPVVVGECRGEPLASDDDLPVLLGLDYFQKGINAINDTINRTKNIRLPVYNYHYTEGNTYFNPFTQVAYKVPDEVSMTVNEAGYEQIDTLYSDSYSASITETTKRYSWQVGVQINFGPLHRGFVLTVTCAWTLHNNKNSSNDRVCFRCCISVVVVVVDGIAAGVTYSDNKQWYNFNLEEHERMNYVSHSEMWWKFWEIMAYPMEVLGPNSVDPLFKSFLDKLPPTISGPNDTAKYDLLLDNWGTHYVTWANYGGQLNLDIFTNGSFDRSQTQKWNSDQHSLAFHFTLFDIDPSAQIAGFTNKSQIHVNQSYLNQSRVYLYYEGGDPTLMGEDSLRPWLNTLQKLPHWLNVTYLPLSKLPFLSPQVASTLDGYIIDYLKKATA